MTQYATLQPPWRDPSFVSFSFSLKFDFGVRQGQRTDTQEWEMNGTKMHDMKDTKIKWKENVKKSWYRMKWTCSCWSTSDFDPRAHFTTARDDFGFYSWLMGGVPGIWHVEVRKLLNSLLIHREDSENQTHLSSTSIRNLPWHLRLTSLP